MAASIKVKGGSAIKVKELVFILVVVFVLLLYMCHIWRSNPLSFWDGLTAAPTKTTLMKPAKEGITKDRQYYQHEREVRDAQLGPIKRINRQLFNLTSAGGKIDLGTPCLTSLDTQKPIGTHGRSASGHYFAPFKCSTHVSPISGRQQCCCREFKEAGSPEALGRDVMGPDELPYTFSDKLRCLPSFVVIGVQKSGTTALVGFMITHPNFMPPINKEIHWLDQARTFRRGTNWYITRFHHMDHPGADSHTACRLPFSIVLSFTFQTPQKT
jgi:hypothetical protein